MTLVEGSFDESNKKSIVVIYYLKLAASIKKLTSNFQKCTWLNLQVVNFFHAHV